MGRVYGLKWVEIQKDRVGNERQVEKSSTFPTEKARDTFYQRIQDKENFVGFTDHWQEIPNE